MGVAEDVAVYLASEGHITALGTDCFAGFMPEQPDVAVVLTETTGRAPELTASSTNRAVIYTGLQVRVRGTRTGYAAARDLADDILSSLVKVLDTTISGTRYQAFLPQQSVSFMSRDANERPEFVVNFQVVQ